MESIDQIFTNIRITNSNDKLTTTTPNDYNSLCICQAKDNKLQAAGQELVRLFPSLIINSDA